MTVAATITIPAPFFLVDVAQMLPELFVLGGPFVLGESDLGGPDVLGGSVPGGPFVLGDSILGGPDVLGNSVPGGPDVLGDSVRHDVLSGVSVSNNSFPQFPPVIVINVGITASPTTGLLTAISGQVLAFMAGSQVQFNLQTYHGSTFSLNAVYSGATNVFIG